LTFEKQFPISSAKQQLLKDLMNKGDLIEAFREETGLTRHKAEAVVDVF